MSRRIEVPVAVRQKAVAGGPATQQWLEELGGLVSDIEREWDITVGRTLDGGTAAYTAEATIADGSPAVIKVAMPDQIDGHAELVREMRALELADGRGCARLLRRDDERSAMLIERLGRQLHELGLPVSRQIEIICTTLHDLWRPVPAGAGLPTVAEKGQWLAEFIARIWEDVDRPCSPRVIDRALVFIERRTAAPSGEAVLVHGDAHAWNTLEAGDGRFKLVDPDGLIGEREYDLAIPMREFNEELLAGDAVAIGQGRARFLAHLTGANVGAIWQWGFVERVSTALYSGLLGQEDWARAAFDVAEQWAVADSL